MNCFITSSLRPRPVVLAIALALSTGAYAQSAQQATSISERAPSLHNYQIPAGQLGATLLEIARVSRTAISVDPALVQGLNAPVIRGDLRVEQAVQRALADHPFVLQRTENGTLTIVKRSDNEARDTGALPEVKVTSAVLADAGQHLNAPVNSGALGSRSVLETPFSSTVVTSADIAERQINKLGDLFATDASVSDNSSAYGAWATYLTVRGLPLDFQNSFRIDGKPFLSYVVTLPYEHMEQIELLKGSTGFMYGFGSPGGLVNYVTKKPTDEPLRTVGVGYSSKGLLSEHVDLGGRVGENGMFGYRLNATHEEGKTFNNGSLNRNTLSLALDARLTDKLTWDFQSIAQDRKAVNTEPTITTVGLVGSRLPSPIRNNNGTIVGGGTYAENTFRFYSTGLKYALAPDWTLSANYSQSATRTRRNESILGLTDSLGNYDDTHSDYGEAYHFNQWQAMLEGKFLTGSFEHQVVVGASSIKLKNDYSSNGFYGLIGTGNLASQNINNYYSTGTLNLFCGGEVSQKALFASDTVKLSQRVSVLAGLRYTDYSQASYSPAGVVTSAYAQDGVKTPTLALMYKLTSNSMAYTSYMESLEPGSKVQIGLSNAGDLLNPLKSKQYEVGIKTDQTDWSATAALFRIEKKSEYTSANTRIQDGLAVYQGLELGAAARLARNWSLGGSLMLLDSEYKNGLANVGNRVAGAPETIVAAQLAYIVPQLPGLKLNANAKYTGATMLRASNNLQVPAYTLLNVGAVYDTRIGGYDTTFRLAINNATDKRYWMFQYDDYVKAGDPRSLTLNATFKF